MKFHSCCRISGALVSLLLLTSTCAGGKAGAGAPHLWPEGTTVVYEMVRGQEQTTEIPGQVSQPRAMSSTFVISVEAVGEREFRLRFLEAYSTPSSIDLEQAVGLESTVRLDTRGVITEATDLEENPYVDARGGIDIFKDDMQNLFVYLPEGPIRPGVEWNREYSYPANQSGMTVQHSQSVTYRCIEETVFEGTPAFRIELISKTEFAGSGDQGGGSTEVQLGGTIEGTIYVESTNGMILSQELGGELEGGFVTQGYDLSMHLKVSLTVKMKK